MSGKRYSRARKQNKLVAQLKYSLGWDAVITPNGYIAATDYRKVQADKPELGLPRIDSLPKV